MNINDQIKNFEEEVVSPLVDQMMATEHLSAPPDPLVPEKVLKEKMKGQLTTFLSGKEVLNRVDSAVNAVIQYIQTNLTQVEIQELAKEWEGGVEEINLLFEQKIEEPIQSVPMITLRQLMSLSEKTLGIFYTAGVKLYESHDYVKASDVFFLLTLIDYQRHNIWFSFGLSEMKNAHYEDALNAFAMAAITKYESPLSYIYSAECCNALQRFQESSNYLVLAKEVVNSLPADQRGNLLNRINALEQKS